MLTQEQFEKVGYGLLRQNARSLRPEPHFGDIEDGAINCRYRGRDDMRCAIGFLIPDELYSEAMEGSSIEHNELVQEAIGVEETDSESIDQLQELQVIHDNPANVPELWRELLTAFARKYGLTPLEATCPA